MEVSIHDNNTSIVIVSIIHEISVENQPIYRSWLERITQQASTTEGLVNDHIFSSKENGFYRYVILLSFNSKEAAHNWLNSPKRLAYLDEIKPYLLNGDRHKIQVDPNFWFSTTNASAKPFNRWQQWGLSWCVALPFASLLPFVVHLVFLLFDQPTISPSFSLSSAIVGAGFMSGMMTLFIPIVAKWVNRVLHR
jgi:antibiotic biosynthesis monooxygenase (ABM) superfamily enzyme